jgi:hypothetical protein
MKITFRICDHSGWQTIIASAPKGADLRCYKLPRGADRFAFWEKEIKQALPRGHVLIWEPSHIRR